MKKSLLASTLIAASFALSVTAFALDGSGTSDSPYYGTIQGTEIFSTEDSTTIYVGTETQALGGDNTNSYFPGHSSQTYYTSNIHINAGGIYITNGNGTDYHYYSGTITGTGDWTVTYVEGASDNSGNTDVTQRYSFTGDLSGWTGNFKIYTVNTGDYVYYGNGNVAATNTNISGNGGSISVDFGEVQYNYTGYAEGTSATALTVTNSSIEAHKVTFTGSVNYEVSSTITGWDGSGSNRDGSTETKAENSTLTISNTGTTTFSGSVSNFDIVTVASGSTLAIASGGSLDLSGATVDLASAIQNSGTVTIDTSTVFVLDNLTPTSGNLTSEEGATYTLITGSSGSVTISGTLDINNVSSSSEITSATFDYTNGVLTVTVIELEDGLHGEGTSSSPYYTSGSGTIVLSTTGTGGILAGDSNTTVYLATDDHSLGSASQNVYWTGGDFTAACNIVIGAAGIYLTNGNSGNKHIFTGDISGTGNWTVGYISGSGSVNQDYTFTGDLSGWSGDFSITTSNTSDYVCYGDGKTVAAKDTNVTGTGAVSVATGTIAFDYIKEDASGKTGPETVTIGNSSLTAAKFEFTGSVNYIVSENTTITSASSSGSFTVSTQGTVTILGTLTTGDSNAFSSLSVAEGSTLRIGADNTFYMDSTSGTFVISGTLEVAKGVSFTIRKRSAATGYSIANLSLEDGSTLLLNTYGTSQPGSSGGLSIGTLTVTGSATLKTDSTGGTNHWQNSMNIAALVGKDATLNLTSDIASSVANIFELGTSGNTKSTSQFTGKISLSDSASGSRGLTLIVSEENIAAGAVIEMGAEDSTDALALGVNADRVEIAGLVSGGSGNNGGDIVYSGYVSMGAALGNAGATLIDYKSQSGYGDGSNYDGVGVTRNTLVINTDTGTEYSFSGVFMDMLNIEKKGAGTQSIEFKLSSAGSTGYYFDGTITVTGGTLNLSGVETNSSGITVAEGATLSISNHITLAATDDITSVSSTISGNLGLSGTLTVSSGATLAIESTASVTINSAISNSGTITIADGASIVVGVEVQTGTYNDANYQYYELISGSGDSASVTVAEGVTFVINGESISLNSLIQRYADSDTWSVYTDNGYLVIYGTASTTAETTDPLYWAGTDGNNTWSTSESNTPWSASEDGSAGYYFQSGASVVFDSTADNKNIVLGENIVANEVNITGSGYTLTASDATNGNTLTATSIVLDDEDSATEHKFTIDTGVKVQAGTLTETAGQLDLVVNGELDVTKMTVTTKQDESISGSGTLKVGTLEYSSDHGVSLTISVAQAEFGSITEQASGGNESNGALRHLIFGDGTNTTTATVTSMEIKGLSEVQVAEGSELTITNLVDSSGWNTTISGDGSVKIGSMTVSGNSTNGGSMLTISIANFESGDIAFTGTNSLTISSASFKADSIVFTGGSTGNTSGAGGITISSSANATVGLIQSDTTHTLTVENGATLTAGEIYRSGNTLNLAVNGTLTVDQLSGYGDDPTSGMIYFGKSTDGATSMAQTISGTGTANVYGIGANIGTGSLTISVTNLNIGAGGITRYGSGNGTITINGTTIGLYNTDTSEISAAVTIGDSGVTFNPESEGQTITLSGTVTGTGLVTKTGDGELAFTGTGSSLTNGLTVSAGTLSVAAEASLELGGTVTLASAISNSGTITIAEGTSFVIDGIEMGNDGSHDYYVLITGNGGTISGSVTINNFSGVELDGTWSVYTDGGYLVIYGEAQAEVSNLTWAGTEGNNTWNTVSGNTIWKNDADESAAFTTGSNVTFDDTTATNKSVVLGEAIEAGSITVTGTGYELSGEYKLTATELILADTDTDSGEHTFTIAEGTTVEVGKLTEDVGQMNLVVDGSLNVTESMHIDSSENEVISGSGRIEVKNFTYDAAQGSSLTITVGEFSFSDFVEKPSGEDNASSDAYRTLIIGSEEGDIPEGAWYSTEVSGAYAEISGKSEVRVNQNSMFAALTIHNYSDYDLLISGAGLFYANEFDLAGKGTLIISCAEVEAGVVYNSKENIVIEEGGQLAVGDFEHTTIVEGDDEVYTEGLLNLQVDGTFIVDILDDYVDPSGTLSFGTEDSETTLEGSHSISGTGTANIYKLEYGADGAGLEISVANLNIGAGGISATDGASSLVLDGVTVGVYAGLDEENTSWSTEANLTLKNDVTFNTKANESITLAGGVATDEGSSLTKTGEGTLTLAGEATLSGLTVSGGILSVATNASLTLAGNDKVDILLDGGMLAIAKDATVSSGSDVNTSVTISNGGQLSLGDSVSLNVDAMEIILSTANYDASGDRSGTFAIIGDSTSSLTLTDSAAITITVDSALETLLSGEGTYYFDISDGISDLTLDWSALTRYGTVSYNDGILSVFVGAIPEPELFSIFFGLGAIGLVATRRRRRRKVA